MEYMLFGLDWVPHSKWVGGSRINGIVSLLIARAPSFCGPINDWQCRMLVVRASGVRSAPSVLHGFCGSKCHVHVALGIVVASTR